MENIKCVNRTDCQFFTMAYYCRKLRNYPFYICKKLYYFLFNPAKSCNFSHINLQKVVFLYLEIQKVII